MSSRPYYGAIRVTTDDDDNNDEALGNDDGITNGTNRVNMNDGERAPLLQTPNIVQSRSTGTGTGEEDFPPAPTTTATAARESVGMMHQHSIININTVHQRISSLASEVKAHFSKVNDLLGAYWSDITFDWISPLIQMGNANGQLNLQDLDTLPLPSDCETNEVYAVFSKCWKAELDKAKKNTKQSSSIIEGGNSNSSNNGEGKKSVDDGDMLLDGLLDQQGSNNIHNNYSYNNYQPSLIRALYNAFGADFLHAGLLKLVHDSCLFVGPQVLNRLIRFLRDENASMSYGLSLMLLGELVLYPLFVIATAISPFLYYPLITSSNVTIIHACVLLCMQ